MDNAKYIGMDVHTETISIAVLNSTGKLVMESVIETKALTVIQFMQAGWKVRNFPAVGEAFFLTFPLIELHRTWPAKTKNSIGDGSGSAYKGAINLV